MVKDICPGPTGSDPLYLKNVNEELFFSANDCSNGSELWMYVDIPNDECEDAAQADLGEVYYGSNFSAAGTDLTSCAFNDDADVWFCYTPQVSGEYTISAVSNEFDTTLAVFNACGGNELACNDDYLTTDSQLVLYMVDGKNYYIRIAGFDGQMGNYEFAVDAGACTQLAQGDINGDCAVDFLDFAIMASEWLSCNLSPPELCW
jgi:hypothetical protein